MAETLTDVYIKSIQIIITIIILSILVYRRRQHQLHALNWLIIIFSFGTLQGIVEIITYVIKIYWLKLDNPIYFRFNEVHLIPYGITIFFIYLLAEAMMEDRPNPWRFFIVSSLWAASMSIMFFQIFNNYSVEFSDKEAPHQFFNIAFDVFQLVAMLFASYVFWQSFRHSKNKENQRATFWLFFAVFIFALVTVYELVEQIFSLTDIYGVWLYGFSFLILAYVYLKYPYFVLGNPNRIYRIVLSTKSGLLIYSADLEGLENGSSDELLAGGVTAISEFITETSGATGPLNFVQFSNRALIVRRIDNIVGFIIAEKATRMLWSALRQFVQEFTSNYTSIVQEDIGSKADKFAIPETIITRCFPFVEPTTITHSRLNSEIAVII
jgi:hypothetical protein